jgi:hypothetical protein
MRQKCVLAEIDSGPADVWLEELFVGLSGEFKMDVVSQLLESVGRGVRQPFPLAGRPAMLDRVEFCSMR